METTTRHDAPAATPRSAYLLGAPISLADLLALPPDGNRYGRDEKGRLVLVAPDDAAGHRLPVSRAVRRIVQATDPALYEVVPEAPITFERVYALDGSVLPPSHHGPKALVVDFACFSRPVRVVRAPSGHTWFSPEGLVLVAEFVSPSSWANDLGEGSSREEVDRWRTYLEAAVPEYWIFNAGFERAGLPPRSGLFLSYDRGLGTWADLPVEGARFAERDYRGRRPVAGGVVRSRAVPGLALDLDELWRDCAV